MNIRAEELGLSSLTFSNTTGLDLPGPRAGGTGNARDVSLLLAYMLEQYPSLLSTSTDQIARVYNSDGGIHTVENTNPITAELPNLLASKTGYTDLAGGNLTIAFDAGFDRPIIVTVLGSSRQGRFTDVATLVAAVRNQTIQ
jgi:D-alanyl-D-alanine carboxypeptidase